MSRAHAVTCAYQRNAEWRLYQCYHHEAKSQEEWSHNLPWTQEQKKERRSKRLQKCEYKQKCTSSHMCSENCNWRQAQRNTESQRYTRQSVRQIIWYVEYITVSQTARAPTLVHANARLVPPSNRSALTQTEGCVARWHGPEPPQLHPSQHIHFEQPRQPQDQRESCQPDTTWWALETTSLWAWYGHLTSTGEREGGLSY